MNPITKYLEAVNARLSAATPGPWSTEGKLGDFYVCFFEIVDDKIKSAIYAPNAKDIQMWSRNAPLIASAPTDLQKLTRALEVAVLALEFYASGENLYQSNLHDICEGKFGGPLGTNARQAISEITKIVGGT